MLHLFLAALAFITLRSLPVETLHPHFKKRIEIELSRKGSPPVILKVSHLTATFDKSGFEKMEKGGTWHLANCQLETSHALEIGGKEVLAGKYRIVARKADGGKWELVLDEPKDFSGVLGTKALSVVTDFRDKMPLHEHLHVDLQPSGDKQNTVLELIVSFDTVRASAGIKIK